MRYRFPIAVISLLLFNWGYKSFAQPNIQLAANKPWNASWIKVPGEPANDYEVCLFRKIINLTSKPAT